MIKTYDLIVIGAGSVGVPAALEFTRKGQSVLVLDSLPSPGQGQNKTALGGIRCSHSNKGKFLVGRRGIEIFSTWQEEYGDDIKFYRMGYSWPVYREEDEVSLKETMKVQQNFGMNIKWLSPEEYEELNPGINMIGLRGSIYSPDDASASPLLFIQSCYFKAIDNGAEFRFNEPVVGLDISNDTIHAVRTTKGKYCAKNVLNAAGSFAREVARMAGIDTPVMPDTHEAGISEPVAKFMGPMVIDMRPGPGSANCYFYQNGEGKVFFCVTPDPLIQGTDRRPTSQFLPMISKRIIDLMPKLANLKVRRTWRGQYPMTPDAFPLVGKIIELENFYQAVGMCGQGFQLGPGYAELLYRLMNEICSAEDVDILKEADPYRNFSGEEVFK